MDIIIIVICVVSILVCSFLTYLKYKSMEKKNEI